MLIGPKIQLGYKLSLTLCLGNAHGRRIISDTDISPAGLKIQTKRDWYPPAVNGRNR